MGLILRSPSQNSGRAQDCAPLVHSLIDQLDYFVCVVLESDAGVAKHAALQFQPHRSKPYLARHDARHR